MGKKVVVISASLRRNSNSDALARAFVQGAKEAGHQVTYISLRDKKLAYCLGCMRCYAIGECVIKDDAIAIEKEVVAADVVVWATPVYYYQMAGQMKTLMDRLNPMYPKAYQFGDVYLLATAAENARHAYEHVENGVKAWAANFARARFVGTLFCGSVNAEGEIAGNKKLTEAYEMGRKC